VPLYDRKIGKHHTKNGLEHDIAHYDSQRNRSKWIVRMKTEQGFDVLTAGIMKSSTGLSEEAISSLLAPCFILASSLATSSCYTSAEFRKTTCLNIPEDRTRGG
jgi:hypothetical protein